MRKSLTVCFVVVALAGVGSCASGGRQSSAERQAAVVLQLYMDKGGACKLTQKTPGAVETAPGRTVRWFVVGGCKGATVAISQQVTKNGQPYDPWDPDPDLASKAPEPGGPGNFVVLQGTIRSDAVPAVYEYHILINGAPAEYNSKADPGDFEICPDWPCDGLSQ